jgi:transketolase
MANLEMFSLTLRELARRDRSLIVVTSDSRGSGKLVPFAEEFPDQIVEVGIAEQNLVGVAAGLASAGKHVFAVSPASFLTARALEQIKNDVAYSDNPVTLVGISAGVSYGALGSTHHAIHDLAVLRAINNLTVVVPADNHETRQAVEAAWRADYPVYLRFGKKKMPHVNAAGTAFTFGTAGIPREGGDIALVATGEAVAPAVETADLLAREGIAATVVSMHTIKPLDTRTLCRVARSVRAVITVEEHMVHGGLGEACASVLLQSGIAAPFAIVGIPDQDTVTGSQGEIFAHYGITPDALAARARDLLASVA